MARIIAQRVTADIDGVYNKMPKFGLGKASKIVPASGRRESARGRMSLEASR